MRVFFLQCFIGQNSPSLWMEIPDLTGISEEEQVLGVQVQKCWEMEKINPSYMGVNPKIGENPQNGWFIMENPMNKWMIWWFPHYFWKHQYEQ